jgi:hypothetical protein
MDDAFAMDMLNQWFDSQGKDLVGRSSLTIAPIWRSKTNHQRVHNVWLIAVNDGSGTHIMDASAHVAKVIGEKFQPDSGGILSNGPEVVGAQAKKLADTLGIKLYWNGV